MIIPLRQSTAITVPIGPFLDSTDGVTEETGLAGNGTEIRKAGASFATGPVLGTHDAEGYYPVTLTTSHTDTLGAMRLKSHAAGHLPVWEDFFVFPAAVYDSLFAGSDNLQVDLVQWIGTAPLALTSQRVQTQVGAMGANVLTAAAIAADAIGASELAADAVTEIRDAILNRVLSGNHMTAGTVGLLLQFLDAAVSSRSSHGDPDPSGFLDAAISSRSSHDAAAIWSVVTRTLTANTNLNDPTAAATAAAVWAEATRTLTANTNLNDPTVAAIVAGVWDELTATGRTVGSFGQLLIDRIDAAISSRSSHGDPDPSGFLDVSVASRLAGSQMPSNWPSMAIEADGMVHADLREIVGSAALVTAWRRMLETAVVVTIGSGSTTTNIVTGETEATVDHYNDRVLLFATGALTGQGTDITGYDGAGAFTVTALTEAPVNGDIAVVL